MLLEAPVFSLTKELLVFAGFVLFVILMVILVEIEYKRVTKSTTVVPQDPAYFTKIEEYRNDFPDDAQAS